MMTPSPSGDLATPLLTTVTNDATSAEPMRHSFGVQSINSSVAFSDMTSESPEETAAKDEIERNEEEGRKLEDALRAAMMMSGELKEEDQVITMPLSEEAPSGSHLSPHPTAPSQPHTTFDPSSRSASPSTSSISLSLSTPASPVSMSSIPASMSLSMDLDMDTDSSTSWSLHESSAESRSGSPLSVRNRRTGVGTANQGESFTSGMADSASMGTSRPTLPYAISRRNTATIPRIIRTSSATRAQPDVGMQSSGTHAGSFQSDVTARDTHSRSHWAVQESAERQRYQGDLFELVLPVLDLPGASTTSTGGIGRAVTTQEMAGSRDPGPTASRKGAIPDMGQADTTSGVLNIVLCGTNRTTNNFLREITQDPRFDIYKLPASPRPGQPAPQRGGRTARTSNRSNVADGKDASYTVGLYTAGGQGEKRLVARIRVFGKGQQGNLERALSHIKQTYTRLDSLLRPPTTAEEDDESLGSSDMYGLVESWVWGRADATGGTTNAPEAEWCELAVLTGDGRHLLGQERAMMEELVAMVPTICHPDDLGSLLSLACGFDFYAPDIQASASMEHARPSGDSSTHRLLDLLMKISGEGVTASRAHRQLRKSGVRAFLQWRSANPERSRHASTVLGSRLAESSNTASRTGEASASLASRRLSASAPTDLRPGPTLARARASNEGHPGDWEAGLSRRAALRREITTERIPKPQSKEHLPAKEEKPNPHESSGFFDDRCLGRGYRRSGLGVTEGLRAGWSIVKALVYPLRMAQAVLLPETLTTGKGIGGWGWFKVACLGAVVGLAGLYFAKR